MKARIGASTRLVALLGDPVAHSLSPLFQNAAFDAAGLDAVYLALRCSAEKLPGVLIGIAQAGGAGNITVPHKEIAAGAVEVPSERVIRTRACNTFWLEDGQIHGENTDVAGFVHAAEAVLGKSLRGARVLLLGAGGAARSAAYGLAEVGADEVVVVNRSNDRSEDLCQRFAAPDTRMLARSRESLDGESFDLVVNATSLGLSPDDTLPLPLEGGPRLAAALDMVYSPRRTAWVRGLLERGIPAEDGLEMLVRQGAEAFERWWGFPPSLEAMRSALPQR